MPFKDLEAKREYQREWCRRKARGEVTRTTPVLTPEESLKLKRDRKRRELNARRQRKAKIKLDFLGRSCHFCDHTQELNAHRKDGKSHKKFSHMSYQQLQDELESNMYVHLCSMCHRGVHWCMQYLAMDWSQIETQFKEL